jgi:DNA polymerase-3 subunit epsilon
MTDGENGRERSGLSFRRMVSAGVLLLAALVAVPGMLLVVLAIRGLGGEEVIATAAAVVLATLGAWGVLWRLWLGSRRHFAGLERLRGLLLGLEGRSTGDPIAPYVAVEDREVESLRAVALLLAETLQARRRDPEARLHAILDSVAEPIVVITEDGLVSLVNGSAKALLGAESVAAGTSIFAALSRHAVDAAMDRAKAAGEPIQAEVYTVTSTPLRATVREFGAHGGAIFSFSEAAPNLGTGLDHDLALHERPPKPRPLGDDMALADLPALVFDCETTGLDVTRDRMVSIGAVRLQGARLFRSLVLDRLVNPGVPIPPRSTAIHGITDAMVQSAPNFGTVEPLFRELAEGCVLIGHNVPFDLAILRLEYAAAGIEQPAPRSLDLLQLVTVLDPALESASLDALADFWGVENRGRHTALGDALVTAEIFRVLLPRLADLGVHTLGDADDLCARATSVIRRQTAMGW